MISTDIDSAFLVILTPPVSLGLENGCLQIGQCVVVGEGGNMPRAVEKRGELLRGGLLR